ncbi:hypothetical protein MRX96_037224 [Rhipicephalus microplus]
MVSAAIFGVAYTIAAVQSRYETGPRRTRVRAWNMSGVGRLASRFAECFRFGTPGTAWRTRGGERRRRRRAFNCTPGIVGRVSAPRN